MSQWVHGAVTGTWFGNEDKVQYCAHGMVMYINYGGMMVTDLVTF